MLVLGVELVYVCNRGKVKWEERTLGVREERLVNEHRNGWDGWMVRGVVREVGGVRAAEE